MYRVRFLSRSVHQQGRVLMARLGRQSTMVNCYPSGTEEVWVMNPYASLGTAEAEVGYD